jgi:hypothetical protein
LDAPQQTFDPQPPPPVTVMPRYYFIAEDGRTYPDRHGTELADTAAARIHAVRALGELLNAAPEAFWAEEALSLTVCDEDRLTLFRLEVLAVVSPAAR